jgi:Uncharacterized protein conserved in bacteria (DUF2188)
MVDNTVEDARISWEAVQEQMKSLQSKGRPVHVISHQNGWAVTKEGACKATHVFTQKIDAVRRAQGLVKAGAGAYLIVHKTDGSIEKWEDCPQEEAGITSHSN